MIKQCRFCPSQQNGDCQTMEHEARVHPVEFQEAKIIGLERQKINIDEQIARCKARIEKELAKK